MSASASATAPAQAGRGGDPTGPTGRGRPRRVGVEDAIVVAAGELIAEVGMAGLSMDLIARRAKVSKATIYRRWASKEALVLEMMRTLSEAMTMPDTGSVDGDLRAFTSALAARFAHQRKSDVLPHLIAAACYDDALRAAIDEYIRSRRVTLRDLLKRGVQRGELPADYDIDIAVDMVLGVFFYRRMLTGTPLGGEVAQRICRMVLPRS